MRTAIQRFSPGGTAESSPGRSPGKRFERRTSPAGTAENYPGCSPISVNLLGDVFRQNSHKNVILRACDFFDLFVLFLHLTGCFSTPPQNRHPERSASQIYHITEGSMARSRRTPAMLVGRCSSELSGHNLQGNLAMALVVEKLRAAWVRQAPSGSFDSAPSSAVSSDRSVMRSAQRRANSRADPTPRVHPYSHKPTSKRGSVASRPACPSRARIRSQKPLTSSFSTTPITVRTG